MTRICAALFAFALFFTRPVSAQTASTRSEVKSPLSADEIVKTACKEAASSHRKVFIIFHASWCGWCHKMDNIMAGPDCKKLFLDNYVVEHLVIKESNDKKSLENPGAQELYTKYAGPQGQGIPFWLVIDADGKVIADSRNKPDGAAPGSTGDNVGCPSEPEEIAYFVKVLHATSPLTPAQLDIIKKNFGKAKS